MPIRSKNGVKRGAAVTVSFSDSINLIQDQVHWTSKGVRLLTKWHFAEGTEIEFAFDHQGERHCCAGVVVACHPLSKPSGMYQTVLFFVEVPCPDLQKAACACRLHREENAAADGKPIALTKAAKNGAARGSSRDGSSAA